MSDVNEITSFDPRLKAVTHDTLAYHVIHLSCLCQQSALRLPREFN